MVRLKLHEFRKANKINVLQFCKETGMRVATAHEYFTAEYKQRIDLHTLATIMNHFNITDFNDVMELVEVEQKEELA